jgi:CAAX protease family protein
VTACARPAGRRAGSRRPGRGRTRSCRPAGPDAPGSAFVRPGIIAAAGLGGAGLVRASLSADPGSAQFYQLTAGLAATWTGAALTAGSPAAGRVRPGQLVRPVLTGAATFGLFYGIARVARHWPVLDQAIRSVLRYVDEGSTVPVLIAAGVNAVAEELFFRGAVWELTGGARPLVATTAACTASTAATGNLALVLGGAATSVVFGAERARSGGVVAPAVAHVTWSLLTLTALPPLFRGPHPELV